jgi:hypothetical protein
VRNIAAVTQAPAHASCKQNGDEELQVQSFAPDARAANGKSMRVGGVSV